MIRVKPDSLLSAPQGVWVEVWVVFTHPDKTYWWSRFLTPGFGHCYLLMQTGGRWVILNWGVDALRLAVTHMPTYASLSEFLRPGDTAVRVRAELRERYRAPWVFGPLTCVEMVKAVLGIRSPWILTPHQLYRRVRVGVV